MLLETSTHCSKQTLTALNCPGALGGENTIQAKIRFCENGAQAVMEAHHVSRNAASWPEHSVTWLILPSNFS